MYIPRPSGGGGNDGVSAYTTTTAEFDQPAENTTVGVTVADLTWMAIGQYLFIENGGTYQVTSFNPDPHIVTLTLIDGIPESEGAGIGAKVTPTGKPANVSNVVGTLSLPRWNYVAGGGTPASGKFTYNGSNTVKIHIEQIGGYNLGIIWSNLFTAFAGILLEFTDADGETAVFQMLTATFEGVTTTLGVEPYGQSILSEGPYSVNIQNIIPIVALLNNGGLLDIRSGSGWVANADAGDKTAVIPSSATIASYASALDVVAAGLGSAFVNLAEKTKAMEADVAIKLLPNA